MPDTATAPVTPVTKTPEVTLDRALIESLFTKLDPGITRDAFEAVLKKSGTTETAAIQNVYDELRKLLLKDTSAYSASAVTGISDRLNAAIAAGGAGRIVSLGSSTVDDIAKLANTEIGVRYAINNGLSFALVGTTAIYDQHNVDGGLFKFNPNTGERLYTDEYMKDRAAMLQARLSSNDGTLAVSGNASWVFDDRSQPANLRIEANAAGAERAANHMIFGNDDVNGETINGSNGNDRIYGGGGDDIIRAGVGDDYVEGGTGNDFIEGDRGDDTLLGGAGDDELNGGLGNDKLYGGAGADDLTGGLGDDRMEGGAGFDTYFISAGDGNDTIVDSDGKGEILYNGNVLTAGYAFKDGRWIGGFDGKTTYTFAGDAEEGGTLTINTGTGSIKIHQFKNGMLGLNFGDGTASALANGIDNNYYNDNFGYVASNPATIATISNAASSATPTVTIGVVNGNTKTTSVATEAANTAPTTAIAATSATASTEKSTINPLAEFFAANQTKISYVTGEKISQAINNNAGNAEATFFKGAAAGNKAAYSKLTNALVQADINHALLQFHDDTADDASLGHDNIFNASIGDEALARLSAKGRDAIGVGSLDLKQAEIGLGKVGL